MTKRNKWEVKYLMALAENGQDNIEVAIQLLNEVLELNSMYVGAIELLNSF